MRWQEDVTNCSQVGSELPPVFKSRTEKIRQKERSMVPLVARSVFVGRYSVGEFPVENFEVGTYVRCGEVYRVEV
jgi:hypothetical protein